MKRAFFATIRSALLFLPILALAAGAAANRVDPDSPDAIQVEKPAVVGATAGWFEKARVGLMIHWSPAAVPNTVWAEIGVDLSKAVGDPSWYFNRQQIPVAKWETLASRFNPVLFDADAWVRMAKEVGMKYITFTAKHHEGFAMYDSGVSDYDIVDRSPFRRDVVRELADACRKHNVRLCLYYSQAQDWHHPDGANNAWAHNQANKDFDRYFRQKCIPQVRELLVNYGPIGLFWFDTPAEITRAQGQELFDLVKALQSDCLVNSRIGHGLGDYVSMGDSAFPDAVMKGLWETATTTTRHWFYSEDDRPRMSGKDMARFLAGNVSRGGNVLFNIGPTPKGEIRPEIVAMLKDFGAWMQANSESIYECGPTPFLTPFDWGTVTARPGFLYLHLFRDLKGSLEVNGLATPVRRASTLEDGKVLEYTQNGGESNVYSLNIRLPEHTSTMGHRVLKLKIEGEPQVQPFVLPQHAGIMRFGAGLAYGGIKRQGPGTAAIAAPYARTHSSDGSVGIRSDSFANGNFEGWTRTSEWVSWDFKVKQPGKWKVYLVTSTTFIPGSSGRKWKWTGGHEIAFEAGSSRICGTVRDDKLSIPELRLDPRFDKACLLGEIEIAQTVKQTAAVRLIKLGSGEDPDFTFKAVVLVPSG